MATTTTANRPHGTIFFPGNMIIQLLDTLRFRKIHLNVNKYITAFGCLFPQECQDYYADLGLILTNGSNTFILLANDIWVI